MGSSHVEAFNVAQDKNFVSLLNEKFRESKIDLNAYNIGVSGHKLVRCLYNAENAIEEFHPTQYLIIETSSEDFDINELEEALERKLQTIESNFGGIMGVLQKFPFLRCVYKQVKNTNTKEKESEVINNDKNTEEVQDRSFGELLSRVMEKCNEEGICVIIVHNSPLNFDKYGKIREQDDKDSIEMFSRECKDNDIIFVNMYDLFSDNFNQNFEIPHGFSNSKIGSGHLNECGHRLIADALYSVICEHKNNKEEYK